jgi:hypothetical protein
MVLLVLAMSAQVACVVNDTHPPDRSVIVSTPPPARLAETVPPAPAAGLIWVPGDWHWTGVQWAWLPGHWDQPPVGMKRWNKPHYTLVDGAYRYEPGTWNP